MAAHCGVHPECLSGRWWLIDLLGADTLSTWRNSPSDAILSRGGPEGDGDALEDGESAPPAVDGGRGLSDDEIAAEAAIARDAKVAAATAAANGVGEAELREILRGRPTLEDLQNPRKPTEADMRAGFERHARAMWPRKVVPPHPASPTRRTCPTGKTPSRPTTRCSTRRRRRTGGRPRVEGPAGGGDCAARGRGTRGGGGGRRRQVGGGRGERRRRLQSRRRPRRGTPHRLSAVAAETLREALGGGEGQRRRRRRRCRTDPRARRSVGGGGEERAATTAEPSGARRRRRRRRRRLGQYSARRRWARAAPRALATTRTRAWRWRRWTRRRPTSSSLTRRPRRASMTTLRWVRTRRRARRRADAAAAARPLAARPEAAGARWR